jgi:FtsP/CotA-like multicopper oxidase with cupredoxin domain
MYEFRKSSYSSVKKKFALSKMSMALLSLVSLSLAAPQAYAGAGWADNTDKSGVAFKQPTFYANSPSGTQPGNGPVGTSATRDTGTALRKFVDPLAMLDGYVTTSAALAGANAPTIGRRILTAFPDKVTFMDADYYEIAVVEYREQLHSDLPPVQKKANVAPLGPTVTGGTLLRGYVQIWNRNLKDKLGQPVPPGSQLFYLDGKPILDNKGAVVIAVGDGPHYLGPIIDTQSGTPVRLKFDNYLPTGHFDPLTKTRGGDSFIPTDITVAGAGLGPNGAKDPSNPTPADLYTGNRALIHLHGGDTPWISDGQPHSWIVPAGEKTQYMRGDTAQNVPDMVDPGPGSQTYYFPNQQSARMEWYHDHTVGATRLNVYAGEVSAFMIHDATEAGLINSGALPADEIPLIFEDKTFVPNDIATQDSKWNTDAWGKPGDLWYPHVYESNQNPNSIDGTNPAGRWDYGPWFWPVFPAPLALPTGTYDESRSISNASGVQEAFADTPLINGVAYPNLNVDPKAYRFRLLNASGQRYLNLGLYVAENLSLGVKDGGSGYEPLAPPKVTISGGSGSATATAVVDTTGAVVGFTNVVVAAGTAFKTGEVVTVSIAPPATVFGQANAIPSINATGQLSLVADPTAPGSGYSQATPPSVTVTGGDGSAKVTAIVDGTGAISGFHVYTIVKFTTPPTKVTIDPPPGSSRTAVAVASVNTEVPMVPAVAPVADPTWGVDTYDGRPGGIPDPTSVGPNIIHVGTEGGFLAQPNVIPSTPVSYAQLRRIVTVLNILDHGLYVGPAERADFVVDFSQFAGKTLIVYNDAPAPNPGFDARVDYYTGDVDQSSSGGAPSTLPGQGPNTRTIMRINVGTTNFGQEFDPNGDGGPLASALPAAFAASQDKPIVPQKWQNAAYGTNFEDNLARIFTGSTQQQEFTFEPGPLSTGTTLDKIVLDSAGTGYTTAPLVGIVGGLDTKNANAKAATAHAVLDPAGGRVAYIKIDDPGVGYIATPTINLYSSVDVTTTPPTVIGDGIGAAATASLAGDTTRKIFVQNKGIQELFDANYGRMNATFSSELPFTSVLTQTTIPVGYIDPPTESAADGVAQIWKITHNGVDTHPVHFHLFNVQVINRVAWDGTVVALDPAEYGWKDTVKMNPLEDVYVAIKPKTPLVPFGVPQSIRRYDPTQAEGATAGFSNVDPNTGLATTITNDLHNYDWEYVWHCHILGHEENDFMRVISFNYGTVAPPFVQINTTKTTGNHVEWIDPTPAGGKDALGNPTLGNKQNEIGFIVQRRDNKKDPWSKLPPTMPQSAAQSTLNPAGVMPASVGVVVAANTNSWDDPLPALASTEYRVIAFNSAGYSPADSANTPVDISNGSGGNGVAPAAPASTNSLQIAPNTSPTWDATKGTFKITLTWSFPTTPTSYTLMRSGGLDALGAALPDVDLTKTKTVSLSGGTYTLIDDTATQISTFTYKLLAVNKVNGVSSAVAAPSQLVVTTPFGDAPDMGPASLTQDATVLTDPDIGVTWVAPTNIQFITAYRVERSDVTDGTAPVVAFQNQQFMNPLSGTITPPDNHFLDTTTTAGHSYNYTVTAINGNKVGAVSSNKLNVTAGFALTDVTAVATSSSSVVVNWTAVRAGGNTVTGVKVERSADAGATWSTVFASAPGAVVPSQFVDTTAQPSTTYVYRVTWSGVTATKSSNSVNTPPVDMGRVVAVVNPQIWNQVNIAWDPAPANVNVTGFNVTRTDIVTGGAVSKTVNGVGTSYTDTDVLPGKYVYTVNWLKGNNNAGNLTRSTSVSVVANVVMGNVTASLDPTGLVPVVSWPALSPASSYVTGFRVERSVNNGTWSPLATLSVNNPLVGALTCSLSAGAWSCTDNKAANGTTYSYRVTWRAGSNPVGITKTSTPVTTLYAPAVAVTGLGYVLGTQTTTTRVVTLNWVLPPNNSAGFNPNTGLNVYRDGALLKSLAATATSYRDTVNRNATYKYTVESLNGPVNATQTGPITVTIQ